MPNKKIVYIVRHGQSEGNAAPLFQPHDSPLSDKGNKQAGLVAERARHIHFDALLASPQVRARQTAEAIGKAANKSIEFSDLFVERKMPASMHGKPWTDAAANEVWRKWEESVITPGIKAEDGENYQEIVARADKALEYLQEREEASLLVVSHGHFIRTLIARILLGDDLNGHSLRRFYDLTSLENTGITVLKFTAAFEEDFRWRLWTLNDHAHFAE